MTAAIIRLADHRKRREPPMLDMFGAMEFAALCQLAVFIGAIAATRIAWERLYGRRDQ
jgi:hypothetical protein